MDWQTKSKIMKFTNGCTWNELTEAIKTEYFPTIEFDTVKEKVRRYIRSQPEYLSINNTNKPIGVFSDTHIPFDHPNYLQFVFDTFKLYNVGQVICLGDLVDHHATSRFQTETCAISASDEHKSAKTKVKEYFKMFKKGKLCLGNHDEIPKKQAATVGIGEEFLKTFREAYEIPDTWEIEEEYIIDNVLYKHGLNCCGKDGALNTAIQERMSVVIGHSHSFGGCKYSANKRNIIFGLNAGCGIDIATYAFIYGKHAKFRPTLGCGIVFNESYAIFVPMGSEYFRSNNI